MAKTPKEELAEFEALMKSLEQMHSAPVATKKDDLQELANFEKELANSKGISTISTPRKELTISEVEPIKYPEISTAAKSALYGLTGELIPTIVGAAGAADLGLPLKEGYIAARDIVGEPLRAAAAEEPGIAQSAEIAGLTAALGGGVGGLAALRQLGLKEAAKRTIPVLPKAAAGGAAEQIASAPVTTGKLMTPKEIAEQAAVGGTLGAVLSPLGVSKTPVIEPVIKKTPDVILTPTKVIPEPQVAEKLPGDFIGVANKQEPDINVRLESAKQKIQEKALSKKPDMSEDELPSVEISPEGNAVTIRDPYNPQVESYLALDDDGIARGQVVTQYEKFAGRGKPKEKVKSDAFTGTEAFDASFYVFGDKLKGLEAIWKNDPGLTTNTAEFQKNVHELIDSGLSREAAELESFKNTFTGRLMKKYGFTEAEPTSIDFELDTDGKPIYNEVKVIFTKPQKPRSLSSAANLEPPLDESGQYMLFPEGKMQGYQQKMHGPIQELITPNVSIPEQLTLRPISPQEKIAMDIAKRSGMQMYPDIEQPLLGSGKAGDVYKVYDPETRAMKLVNPEFRRNPFQWMYGREEAATRKQIEDVRNFLPENVSKHLMETRKNVEMPEEGSMMKTGYAFTGDIMEPMEPSRFSRFKNIFDDLNAFSKPTPEFKKQIKELPPKERSFARAILHLGTKEGFDFSKASLDYNNIMINPKTGDYVLTDLGEIGITPPTSRTLKRLPSSKSEMRKKSTGESPGGALPMRFEDTPYKRGLMEREAARRDQELYLNEISRKFGDTPDETNPEYKKLVQEATKAGNAYAKLTSKFPTSQDFENERSWINEQIRVIEERFKDKKRPYYERLKELETAYETATIDIKPDIEAKIAKIDEQIQLLDKDEIDKLEPYVSDSRKNINDFIEAVTKNPEMLEVTDPNSDLMFHYNKYLSRKKTSKENIADALETVGKDSKLIQTLINKLRGKKGGGGSGGEGGSGGLPPGGTPPPQLPPAGGKASAKDELVKAPKQNTPFSNIQTDDPKTLVKEFEKYFQKQKIPVTTVEGGVSYETAPIVYQRPGGPPVIGLNEQIKKMDLPKIYPRIERDIVKYETSLEPAVEEYNNLQSLIKTATDQQIRDAAIIRSKQLKRFIDDQRYELAQLKIAHIYGQRKDWLDEIVITNKGRRYKTPKVFMDWDRNSNSFSIRDMTEDAGNLYYASGAVNDDGVMVNNNIYTVDFNSPIDPATGERPRSKMFRGGELMQYYMYFFRNSVKAIRELYVEGNHETFQKVFDKAYPVLRLQHSQKIAEELALREAAAGTFSGKEHLSRGFDIKAVVGEKYKAGDLGYPSAMYDIRPKAKGSGGKI